MAVTGCELKCNFVVTIIFSTSALISCIYYKQPYDFIAYICRSEAILFYWVTPVIPSADLVEGGWGKKDSVSSGHLKILFSFG